MPAYDLNGKVALVTGAARGIGYETARQLRMRGASVAVVDLDAQQAAEAAERIGGEAIGIAADVTDRGALMAASAQTVERFGGIDVAVANAGIAPEGASARTMPPEEFERVIDVDLFGVYNTVLATLPQVVERRGQLAIVSSMAAVLNTPFLSPYSAAKAGVEALGRSLRLELAPLGAGSTVAYFGWIDTEMVRKGLDREEGGKRLQEAMPKFLLKRLPVEAAAGALVEGIEQRAPRVFAPSWTRYIFALRGVLVPLTERHMVRNRDLAEAIRQGEAEKLARSGEPAPGGAAIEAPSGPTP